MLLGILVVAGLFRWIGLGFGLPDAFHPDEYKIVTTVVQFGLTGDFNPHQFAYPSLYYYLLFLVYLIAYLVAYGCFGINWAQFWQIPLAYPTVFILLARLTTSLSGIATVWLLYQLGKETYGKKVGIIAALFLSLTYLHVRDSHFGTTDVPVTLLFILALLFAVRLVNNPKFKNYLWFGIFAGLAAGMKYNAGMICIALLISHYLVIQADKTQNNSDHNRLRLAQQKQYGRYFGIAALIAILFFLISSPFIILDFRNFWIDFTNEARHLRLGHYGIDLGLGWIYHLQFSLYYGLGLPYLVTAILGILWAMKKRTGADYILVAQTLFYYFWIGSGKTVFVRYMMPIVPLLALFTARFLVEIIQQPFFDFVPSRPNLKRISALVFIIGILSLSINNLVQFDMLLQQQDTRTLAKEWIQSHIPLHSKIAVLDRRQGKPQIDTTQYQVVLIGSKGGNPTWLTPEYVSHLSHDDNIGVLVVDFHPLFYSTPPAKLLEVQPGKIAAEFRPVSDDISGFGNAVFDPIDAFYVPLAHFKGYLRGGPWIRIYYFS